MILFWFGVIYQLSAITDYPREYYMHNTIQGAPADLIFSHWLFTLEGFIYPLFGHVTHIIVGYLLAKGKKIGAIAGIAIGIWEIVPFFTLHINETLANPGDISVRILFGIVILLIILGRKELDNLQTENWRPWKNPRKVHTNYPPLMQNEKPFDLTPVSKLRIVIGILLISAGIILLVAQSARVIITENFLEFNIPGIAGITIGISMLERWERASKSKV